MKDNKDDIERRRFLKYLFAVGAFGISSFLGFKKEEGFYSAKIKNFHIGTSEATGTCGVGYGCSGGGGQCGVGYGCAGGGGQCGVGYGCAGSGYEAPTSPQGSPPPPSGGGQCGVGYGCAGGGGQCGVGYGCAGR